MRKNRLKRIRRLLLILCLCFIADCSTVNAKAVPDLSLKGSITVTMKDPETENPVPGGTITLFKAGNVLEKDGKFSFVLTKEFAGSKEELEVPDAALARRLADYAKKENCRGTSVVIDNNGTAKFADVKPGLYLLVQEQAADGYCLVSPFLVSIPLLEDGTYIYDVDASPKMELLRRKENTPPDESSPDEPSGKTPRTGDDSGLIPWLLLLLISILEIAGALAATKEGRHRGKGNKNKTQD